MCLHMLHQLQLVARPDCLRMNVWPDILSCRCCLCSMQAQALNCTLITLGCMQMTQKILEAEGEGDPEQLDFFLKGNLALEKSSRRKPHTWLPDQVSCLLSSA